jgi:hypothetical protein
MFEYMPGQFILLNSPSLYLAHTYTHTHPYTQTHTHTHTQTSARDFVEIAERFSLKVRR